MLLTAIAALLVQPPAAAEVIFEGQGARYTLDPASIHAEGGDRVSVRTRMVMDPPRDDARQFDLKMLFDCRARTMGVLNAQVTATDGTVTRPSYDTPLSDLAMQPVGTANATAMILARVCPHPPS